MTEKLLFPIRFEQCPICKHDRHVAEAIVEEMVKKGKWTSGKPSGVKVEVIVIADLSKTTLTSPHLTIVRDICAKCGFESPVYVDCKELPLDLSALGITGQKLPKAG